VLERTGVRSGWSAHCLTTVMSLDPTRPDECRILVVDDNRDAADTLVSLLDLFGYAAVAVYDGEHAVLASEALHPSLIFLDIDMPGMDGYATATCIRNAELAPDNAGHAPAELVALTARNSDADKVLTSAVGFDLRVQKPIGAKQLCRLAEKACPKH